MEYLGSKPNQNEKINAGNFINRLKVRKRLRERKVGKRIREKIVILMSKEWFFHLYNHIYTDPRNYSNNPPHPGIPSIQLTLCNTSS